MSNIVSSVWSSVVSNTVRPLFLVPKTADKRGPQIIEVRIIEV